MRKLGLGWRCWGIKVSPAKEHAMTNYMKDTMRLLRTRQLTGLSMMEFPSLRKMLEWFRRLLLGKRGGGASGEA